MIDFCILGSGIAGSTIANLLSKKYTVEVFDKARGPGGRASNKRFKLDLGFDHGAQYISPKTKEFKKFISNLAQKKILKAWGGNHLDFFLNIKNENIKYIGKTANNDICKYQLKNIKQNYFSNITKIEYKKNHWVIILKDNQKCKFKRLILTCPFPQLKKIGRKYLSKKLLKLNVKMEPNITVMLAFKNQKNLPISSLKFKDNIVAWASNENSKKRFISKINLWTLQSRSLWAAKVINKYKDKKVYYTNILINRFFSLTRINVSKIEYRSIHGWKYSYSKKPTSLNSYWNKKYQLGVCGDWFLGPKIEHAWLSANNLFKKISKE